MTRKYSPNWRLAGFPNGFICIVPFVYDALIVDEIPDDCEQVDIDDLLYFDCIDIWFREVSRGGRTKYMVVEAPH